jgi:haloacetate dehalogenase
MRSARDYRAAATIDLEHDRADREAGVQGRSCSRYQVMWGESGIVGKCFDPLAEWHPGRSQCSRCRGTLRPHIPEEAPEALLASALPFLLGD